MQPMWLWLFSCIHFEDTFENAQWRKVKQMQPMWLCLFSGRRFEETYENSQWRKVKPMQTMWLCLFSGTTFEETFENTQWRKVKQMKPMHCDICTLGTIAWCLKTTKSARRVVTVFHLLHLRHRPNVQASSQAGHLRIHLKMHRRDLLYRCIF